MGWRLTKYSLHMNDVRVLRIGGELLDGMKHLTHSGGLHVQAENQRKVKSNYYHI